jgi:transposase InsO family protein
VPRITRELRDEGHHVNHKRVERLMRREHIVGHRPRKRRNLTKQDAQAALAPDLLGRLFDPDHPDVDWCGDITYALRACPRALDLASSGLALSDQRIAGCPTVWSGAVRRSLPTHGGGEHQCTCEQERGADGQDAQRSQHQKNDPTDGQQCASS